ncbi:acetyltransferase [Caballeronia terrestris]|uniref:Acetyltransferase n=2 Tax=Caballeronia terrestris TaxID=1226301 RepID=A0A158L1U5_9BURK|nr:acetyltransferase [Caballeronia terrestris]
MPSEMIPLSNKPEPDPHPVLNRCDTRKSRLSITYVARGQCHVMLRRFDPARDSFDELTGMLHRAFAPLGEMGLNCTCVDQSVALTRERVARGTCYIAVCKGRIVGTMTLYVRDPYSCCELYGRGDVASIRQFGVDPAHQGRGIGKLMLAFAEHWVAARGYAELALDTPQPAAHLMAFYRGQGFRITEFVRFPGKRYNSAILSKPAIAYRARATWSHRIELSHAGSARAA